MPSTTDVISLISYVFLQALLLLISFAHCFLDISSHEVDLESCTSGSEIGSVDTVGLFSYSALSHALI